MPYVSYPWDGGPSEPQIDLRGQADALGRAPLSVDSTSTKVEHNIQQLYLQAPNRQPDPRVSIDVTAAPHAGNGATIEW
jgi:hypothetical protein